jgi:predicted TIM-barrel fold metal-dependent hydrolase
MERDAVQHKPAPLVDAHVHVFTSDMPLRDNPRHTPTYSFTAENLLSVLEEHDVGFAVIAAASPWLDYNDYVIDSVRRNPRFRGTVIVEPTVERYILEMMKRDGIVGVRMHMIGLDDMPDITTFEYRRTFKRIADLGWHIHLHAEGKHLLDLLPHFEKTGAKLVIDHLGRPDPEGGVNSEGFKAMLRLMENGRTWVKASGCHRLGEEASTEYLREIIRQAGPDRLVWGSDCPFVGQEGTPYQSSIDWLLHAVDDEDARRKIMGQNALELYFS